MKSKFFKFFTAFGILGLSSLTLVSCLNNDNTLENNDNINVSFDFTDKARSEFNTELITFPTQKTFEVGTSLLEIVNDISVEVAIDFTNSAYQDYSWVINNTVIDESTILQEDVTISLEAIRTHKEVGAIISFSDSNVDGLTAGPLDDFRRLLTLGDYNFSNIQEELRGIIENLATNNVSIDFQDDFEDYRHLNLDFAWITAIVTDNTITDEPEEEEIPADHTRFNISLFEEGDDRFSSGVGAALEGRHIPMPNALLLPFPAIAITRHTFVRLSILELINTHHENVMFRESDFLVRTGGTADQGTAHLFDVEITLSPASIQINYLQDDYFVRNDDMSTIVVTLETDLRIPVARFLRDERWHEDAGTESPYLQFIRVYIAENIAFLLVHNDSLVTKALDEDMFSFDQTAIAADNSILFELRILADTNNISIIDIQEDTLTIENETNQELLGLAEAEEISIPRATALDENNTLATMLTSLVENQLKNAELGGLPLELDYNFVINFTEETPANTELMFNVVIDGLSVRIINFLNEYAIQNSTVVDLGGIPFDMLALFMATSDMDAVIMVPRILFVFGPDYMSFIRTELETRLFEGVMDDLGDFDGMFSLPYEAGTGSFVFHLGFFSVEGVDTVVITNDGTDTGLGTFTLRIDPNIANAVFGENRFIVFNINTRIISGNMQDFIDEFLDSFVSTFNNSSIIALDSFIRNFDAVTLASADNSAINPTITRSEQFSIRKLGADGTTEANLIPPMVTEHDSEMVLIAIVEEIALNLEFETFEGSTGTTEARLVGQGHWQQVSHLVIPTYHEGFRVTELGNGAAIFDGTESIQSIQFPFHLRKINTSAFANSLAPVSNKIVLNNLPYLEEIANDAFASIRNIDRRARHLLLNNLPSLHTIGTGAFRDTTLSTVSMIDLNSLSNIGRNIFGNSGGTLATFNFQNINNDLVWNEPAVALNWMSVRTFTLLDHTGTAPAWWTNLRNNFPDDNLTSTNRNNFNNSTVTTNSNSFVIPQEFSDSPGLWFSY